MASVQFSMIHEIKSIQSIFAQLIGVWLGFNTDFICTSAYSTPVLAQLPPGKQGLGMPNSKVTLISFYLITLLWNSMWLRLTPRSGGIKNLKLKSPGTPGHMSEHPNGMSNSAISWFLSQPGPDLRAQSWALPAFPTLSRSKAFLICCWRSCKRPDRWCLLAEVAQASFEQQSVSSSPCGNHLCDHSCSHSAQSLLSICISSGLHRC